MLKSITDRQTNTVEVLYAVLTWALLFDIEAIMGTEN